MNFEVIHGDCLLEMPKLIERGVKVDACITDPPYGTTDCAWDSVIPFVPMWVNLKALVKRSGAIVLFGSQPFTSALVMSNPRMFKHEWVWEKDKTASFALCNVRPMQVTEYMSVFCGATLSYYPQMTERTESRIDIFARQKIYSERHETAPLRSDLPSQKEYTHSYPRNILKFTSCFDGKVHPTQKPVELMRYLVRTYTNKGDTVLDFTAGSFSTGVACVIEGRNFIGIEQDANYCAIGEARMRRASGIACDIPKPARPYAPAPLFDIAS